MSTVSPQEFNRQRFEEVVLYVTERTKDDVGFGRTKLAKVLFYSDIESFRETGSAITNAEYQNWEHGPFPPALQSAERLLKHSGLVTYADANEDPDTTHLVPTGQRQADLERLGLSAAQVGIIDACIARVAQMTARDVRRVSHEHPGYRMVQRNEVIPYEAAFLATEPPSADDAERVRAFARKQGWLDGDEWQWERQR